MSLSRSIRLLALSFATLTGGCSGGAEELFIRPGRFDYYECPAIATARETAGRRERELKTLIDRAEKDPLGGLIATASYRGEYLRAQGELKMLAEAAQQKNCPPDGPAQAPAR